MIRAIIIGHGDFARAMLDTAVQIVGAQDGVEILSNKACSCDALRRNIIETLDRKEGTETILFLDLPGGSCTISCHSLLKDRPDLNIISGINLPMLIEFFMLREKHGVQDLIPILIKKGKDNIVQLRRKNG